MTKAIVILDRATDEVVKSFPIDNLSEREVEKLERGLTYKLDFERFWMDERELGE